MAKIAIVTLDTFGAKMAGPAIRVWEMASELSAEHRVKVLSFGGVERTSEIFSLVATSVPAFEAELGQPDVVILQGFFLQTFPWLGERDFKLVIDLYDPFHIESLEVSKNAPASEREYANKYSVAEINRQIAVGDFFLYATQRQKAFWIGHLAAAGRLNPATYDADSSLTNLLAEVPFGIQNETPEQSYHGARGKIEGIGQDDILVVWGGGIYNWFDPCTAVAAVAKLAEDFPTLRLLFIGAKHPNPDVPEMAAAVAARRLAKELGVYNTHVFFNEDWVDYEERHNFLMDGDIAISTHLDGIETYFSFRTRMLDYLWAGLPIVCSQGDYFGEIVDAEGLGRVIPIGDVDACARAIAELAGNPELRAQMSERIGQRVEAMRWREVLRPLVEYCRDPYYAADRPAGQREVVQAAQDAPGRSASYLLSSAVASVRKNGVVSTAKRAVRYAQRRLHR